MVVDASALDWLPANGDWRVVEKGIGRALVAFQMCSGLGSVEADGGNYGPRGGFAVRWRLTPAGVALFHGDKQSGGGQS